MIQIIVLISVFYTTFCIDPETQWKALCSLQKAVLQENQPWTCDKPTVKYCEFVGVSCDDLAVTKIKITDGVNGAIPSSITDMPELREIELEGDDTGITGLPDNFGDLSKLETLKFFTNQLTSMPDSISQLKLLTEIDFSNGKLTTLPPFAPGSLIETMDLSSNKFDEIPEAVTALSKLRTLDMTFNPLSTIPDSIGDLASLTSLRTSYSKFKKLPETFGKLKKLYSLEMTCNQLVELPHGIQNLTVLSSLDISCDEETGVHNMMLDWKLLTNLEFLTDINMNNVNISSTMPGQEAIPSNLKNLGMKNCGLFGSVVTYDDDTDLQSVDFSKNDLRGLIPSEYYCGDVLDECDFTENPWLTCKREYDYCCQVRCHGERR